ncbi:hypothetical protein EHQ43_04690 [Leptospira bouyouniensis]|uniref:Uncharacterized protein n=1 Tax=Leptospira bouyouniensis TaxID=2484911 RepID=A0A7I0HVX6_9LEPT|nr:hypothetical protein EHQ43_04690 [Leptospira bouyouniensis]
MEFDSRQYPSNPLPKKKNWVVSTKVKSPAIHRKETIYPNLFPSDQKSRQFLDKLSVPPPAV